MSAERLLQNFDCISKTPDAIPGLRRFILDLAVRGRLVDQDPSDEPASELMKRVALRKQGARKAGYRRQDTSEAPFGLPPGWEWVPATQPALVVSDFGKKIKTQDVLAQGRFPVVDQGKVLVRGYSNDPQLVIQVSSPVIVFGDHTREVKLVDFDFVVGADGVKLLQPIEVLPAYYYIALKWVPLDNRGYGRHYKLLRTALIPIPPLAEQLRIVAKVNDLMALCDELEAALAKCERDRNQLVASTLHQLEDRVPHRNAQTDPACQPAIRFLFAHLPRLVGRPEHLQQLRQTILSLAMQGRLVLHESAADRAGSQVERPQELPPSWRWVTLSEVASSRLGKMLDQTRNKGLPRRYLRNVNVRWFNFDLSDLAEMRFEDSELDEFSLRPGDVLVCEGGEPGRAAVWNGGDTDVYFQKAIHRVRLDESVVPEYFVYCLYRDAHSGRLSDLFTGVTIKHLTGKSLAKYSFPLPPKAEQGRILSKVNELMAIIDELEVRISSGAVLHQQFLEAALSQALVV